MLHKSSMNNPNLNFALCVVFNKFSCVLNRFLLAVLPIAIRDCSDLNSFSWYFIFTFCHSLWRIDWHSNWWKVDGNTACLTNLFHEKDCAFFFTCLSYLTQLWLPCFRHSSLTRFTKIGCHKLIMKETWSRRKRKNHSAVCILITPNSNVKSSRWARIRCGSLLYWGWIQFGLSAIPWASRTNLWRWWPHVIIFRY